jgi:hypothetical protein
MRRVYSITFLCSAAVSAVAFWYFFGRLLSYVVNDSWTEDFATSTRIIVTMLFGVLFGTLATWLVYSYCRSYRPPKSPNS